METKTIPIFGKADFAKMHAAGQLAARVLDYIEPFVEAGVTTEHLDQLCHDFIYAHGGISATLNYHGFPKSSCISLNHVVCHGIPGPRKLRPGDILNIDITVILDGWYGDTSRMFAVAPVAPIAKKLNTVTYDSLMRAIERVRPGATIGDIGHTIQEYVEGYGFSVVRDFCGHGLGRVFHGEPQVPHFGTPGDGVVLEEGMFFTIEPMVNLGKYGVKVLSDGWTTVTRDRSLSAQWEHSLGVTATGYDIFTLSPLQQG